MRPAGTCPRVNGRSLGRLASRRNGLPEEDLGGHIGGVTLSSSQKTALAHVAVSARSRRDEALAVQEHICRMSDIASNDLRDVLSDVRRNARVALHFHPDRPCAGGATVAESLLREGCYRSQYETRISNGGLSAHLGGRRDDCEQRLFGGAYHSPGVTDAERPKYGSLDLLRHAEGPSPRFGSCYFVLSSDVSHRCTFTHLDSHEDPRDVGTLEEFDAVVAAVLRDAFYREFVFGVRDLTVPALIRRLQEAAQLPVGTHAQSTPIRNLNYYIEAQVHGDVELAFDAELLVADPSFQGTETGDALLELCKRYDVKPCWHHGFVIRPDDVPRDFRGPTMPSLAQRVARSGIVDASAIGAAVRELQKEPGAWSDRGTFDEVLQELKLLWHVLVRFGTAEDPQMST